MGEKAPIRFLNCSNSPKGWIVQRLPWERQIELNGVVADTALHDLPGTEPQHFDFGSLERSKRKNDIGGFNLGKVAHGSLSQFLEVEVMRVSTRPHSREADFFGGA